MVQVTGCATTAKQNEYGLPDSQVARITRSIDWLRGRAAALGSLSVDGKSGIWVDHIVLPGRHMVDVPAQWSNNFKEVVTLTVHARPGKHYVVLIYELAHGQDPATAEIRPKTFGEQMGEAGSRGDVQGLAPLILLFAWPFLLHEANKRPPYSRPFESCCFVWIQDAETGEVVVGTSPRNPGTK